MNSTDPIISSSLWESLVFTDNIRDFYDYSYFQFFYIYDINTNDFFELLLIYFY